MERIAPGIVRAGEAADWALSRGESALTTAQLADLLGVPTGQVRQRLNAPARRGEWVSPVRGLWVPVAPEFRTWGAPPGIEIIDQMMSHLGAAYYVGWLSAAALHGAAHQAPQTFQVAVDRHVRERTVGRTRFTFAQRAIDDDAALRHPTRAGTASVSTPAHTVMDLAADADLAGGIHNAATVVVELVDVCDLEASALLRAAERFPLSVLRRVGWILDTFAEDMNLDALRDAAGAGSHAPSRLVPSGPASGPVDTMWNVHVNGPVEPDL